jgi:hypothetical protein
LLTSKITDAGADDNAMCDIMKGRERGNAGGDDQWNADDVYYEGQRERGKPAATASETQDVGCGDLRHDSNTLMNITSFLTNKIKPLSQQTCNMGRKQTLVLDATTCCSLSIALAPFQWRRDPILEEEIRWH